MNHSDQLDKLAKAIAAAQANMPNAPRNSRNPHFKSMYADLPTLWDTCRPVLAKHGLAVVQTFNVNEGSGIVIETTLMHESGQWLSGSLSMPMDKPTPQAAGSAITYGRRYALAAILGMVSDDDDDAEGATSREQPRQQTREQTPSAQPKASAGSVKELRRLIGEAQIEDKVVAAWLDKAGVGDLSDLPQEVVNKLNVFCASKVPANAV